MSPAWQGSSSRVDFVLDLEDGNEMYVEVKSVTMAECLPAAPQSAAGHPTATPGLAGQRAAHGQDRIALFPDAVSIRAQRHVRELMQVVADGKQAAVSKQMLAYCWPVVVGCDS